MWISITKLPSVLLLQFEDDESVNDESVNDEYFVEPENETCDDDSEW